MPQEAIGPYKIVRQLGEGGQGMVYLATAPDGTLVAVKVLREGVPGDGRFAKEIAAARRVEPFCIAQVLDASLGARPYIVTEYVEGPSLAQAGIHAGADLQRLAVATATALAAIHRAGVVHRDFKPGNVLLGRDGPRVIDFGIARAMDTAVTRTSSIVGTPAYMSPEQFLGATVGPPTDVFAWGSVIVYAATGTPPFGNDSLPAVLRRIQYDEPHLGPLPEPMRSVVYACLAKDPAARPAIQDVLFALISGTPMRAPMPPQAPAPMQAPSQAGPAYPLPPPGMPQSPTGPGRPPIPQPGPGHPPVPQPGPGHPPGALHRTGPTNPGRRGRRATTPRRQTTILLTAGTALTVTGALAAAWFWLPIPPGRTSTAPAATIPAPTSARSPSPTVSEGTKDTARPLRPQHTRTPSVDETAASSTEEPTPTRTPTTAGTPTKKSTPKSTAKAGGVKSVSFDYEGIRLGDCWRNDMNIWANVSATGSFSYRWLLNGQNQGRKMSDPSRRPLLPSIVWKRSGTYNVVFEIVSPTPTRKSFSVTICDFDESWYGTTESS
ncbi:serine/threonine protein kinase [Nonomuraea jiangxiensis]|uniref:Serine/threonine protein kinase n=1 Tax=Nonomuraea jiangxiensis TaxID=633440 RepID=A0A1G9A457_9ACTN|nr:serine/threonine-protein kinase [Nonomuraea jiangxiensis]SDK21634.1 Serine/threonine protein kinase [Nonomuraea jiangxiensis]